jgi:hypothetical protein
MAFSWIFVFIYNEWLLYGSFFSLFTFLLYQNKTIFYLFLLFILFLRLYTVFYLIKLRFLFYVHKILIIMRLVYICTL